MKQCPACNRTYANNKQKFCTTDGASLIDVQTPLTEQETVRIDSAQLDKEVTKVISTELPNMPGGGFDPYKTVVSTPPPASTAPPIQPAVPSLTPPSPPPPAVRPVTPPSAEPQMTSAQAPATPSSAAGEAGQMTMPPASAAPVATLPRPPVSSSAAGEAGQVTLPPPSQPARAAAVAAPPVQPRKKRSKLPLILGILFVLLLLGAGGAVAGYFFVLKPILAKRHIAKLEPRRPQPTPIVEQTTDGRNKKTETPTIEVPPYSPPDHAVKFVNSNAKLTGKLAEHFVDFTFYYPKTWIKDPQAGAANSTNFAKVQRQLAADAPQEIFAVGWYGSTGAKDTDEASYPHLVAERSAEFAKTYPEYRKVSEGPAKAGPYDAYEFHFTGVFRNTERGDVKIWGRVMFVPPLEGTRGVTLLMLASSLAPEVKSVNDVGEKGDLPMMLESFRFGK
jgi:hypothetical protein